MGYYEYVSDIGYLPKYAGQLWFREHWNWNWSGSQRTVEIYRLAPDSSTSTNELMGHWVGIETEPPTTFLQAVPSSVRPISLTWPAEDRGGTGVQCFDVDRRTESTLTWTRVLTCAPELGRYTSEVLGPRYGWWRVRARAYDWAGNPGPWSSVRIFEYFKKVQGQVTDVRGRPLGHFVLDLQGSPLQLDFQPRQGTYTLYLDGDRSYRFRHPAFRASSWRTVGYPQTITDSLFLSRREELVRNGDFRASDGWKMGGNLDARIDPAYTLGHATLYAGPGWPTGTGWVRQPITPTASIHQPTLSFYVQYRVYGSSADHRFRVLLQRPGMTTTILTLTHPLTGYVRIWRDLSPWVDRPFTLTFQLDRIMSSTTEAVVWVTNVSITPWTTPWISQTRQVPYVSTVTGTLVLTGSNFFSPSVLLEPFGSWKIQPYTQNSVVVSNTITLIPVGGRPPITLTTFLSRTQTYLEVQVPPGVPPGVYRIRVVHADGTDAVAAEPFISGWPVYLPASLREMWP